MESPTYFCPETDRAERYALKRLAPPAAAEFEQHLAACRACSQSVQFADEFITFSNREAS